MSWRVTVARPQATDGEGESQEDPCLVVARDQAERLMRSYPRAWRDRYGEEFAELLVADLVERPKARWRRVDVVGAGMLARLRATGLTGPSLDPAEQIRASLAALTVSLAVFGACGIGMWSQLTVGWQWSKPDGPSVGLAMYVMTAVDGGAGGPGAAGWRAFGLVRRTLGEVWAVRRATWPSRAGWCRRGDVVGGGLQICPSLARNWRSSMVGTRSGAPRRGRLFLVGNSGCHRLLGTTPSPGVVSCG